MDRTGEGLRHRHPMGRAAQPDEIARRSSSSPATGSRRTTPAKCSHRSVGTRCLDDLQTVRRAPMSRGPRRAERPLRPARWEAVAAASQLYAQDDFRVLLDCSILSSMSTTFSALRTARLRGRSPGLITGGRQGHRSGDVCRFHLKPCALFFAAACSDRPARARSSLRSSPAATCSTPARMAGKPVAGAQSEFCFRSSSPPPSAAAAPHPGRRR